MRIPPIIRSLWASVTGAVAKDPEVQALARRHPRLFSFLAARLDRTRFSGLTLTVLGGLFLYLLFLLLGTVEDLLTSDAIVAADLRINSLMASFRTPGLTRFFLAVTALGTWQVVVSLGAVLALLALLQRRRALALVLPLTLAGGMASTFLGKMAFHRPRPSMVAYVERTFSFPSGHASASVILFGFALYLFWGRMRKGKARGAAVLLTAALILAIGFSRVYLGVHYLSDVWSGFLLGLLWLLTGITAVTWRERLPLPPSAPPVTARPVPAWIPAILLLAELLFCGVVVARYSPRLLPSAGSTHPLPGGDLLTLFTEGSLPPRTETLTGREEEPLSLILLTRDGAMLVSAFARAGWTLADRPTLATLASLAVKAALDRPDPRAPMTPSFWNGAPHDFGFEKPVPGKGIRARHHARFWRTGYLTDDGREAFVGTASEDIGIKWGITHRIRPDIDAERALLVGDLESAGVVSSSRKEQLVQPLMGQNFAGDQFFTDGQVVIMGLSAE